MSPRASQLAHLIYFERNAEIEMLRPMWNFNMPTTAILRGVMSKLQKSQR